jgi:hypothetical protein
MRHAIRREQNGTRRLSVRLTVASVAGMSSLAWSASLAASAGASESLIQWSAPTVIDHSAPYHTGVRLTAVSCPSATLCVATDTVGDVLTSTDPTGGAGAWTVTPVVSGSLSGISCPSVSLCVASDTVGNVLTSTDPTGGAGAWTVTPVVLGSLSGISCPSDSLCVAVVGTITGVGVAGGIVSSTDPTGGAKDWTLARVDGTIAINAISCPSISLCVAADEEGDVVASTNPTGGAGAWTITRVESDGSSYTPLYSVSCASASLCAIGDQQAEVLTSTDPTAVRGLGRWQTWRPSSTIFTVSRAPRSPCV